MVTTGVDLSGGLVLAQRPATGRDTAWRWLGSLIAAGGVVAWAVLLRPSDVGNVAYGIITVYVMSIATVILFAAWSTAHPVHVSLRPIPTAVGDLPLSYLDENGELRLDTVKRLRLYASALLNGSITPAAVAEDWGDFYDLVSAFIATYAPRSMAESEGAATFRTDPRD
jgi:hypothetical protein